MESAVKVIKGERNETAIIDEFSRNALVNYPI
jgi:hypothetical protein